MSLHQLIADRAVVTSELVIQFVRPSETKMKIHTPSLKLLRISKQ